jgi:hypothetical protein
MRKVRTVFESLDAGRKFEHRGKPWVKTGPETAEPDGGPAIKAPVRFPPHLKVVVTED